jgi:thymidylate synthase (FAD)
MVKREDPFGVNQTKRYVSEGGEQELYVKHKIENSGEVELVDYMGGDAMVERVATAGHGRSILPDNPSREKLLNYLAISGIQDPFKSVQFKFCIQSPIEVALSFVYEPSANVNEYSGRYSEMLKSSYIPSVSEISFGMEGNEVEEKAEKIHKILIGQREKIYENYGKLLGDLNMARELARTPLGINNDTRFFWKIDLASLVDFTKRKRKFFHTDNIATYYIDQVERTASRVSKLAFNALYADFDIHSGDKVNLPTDSEVVDGPLSPPSWKPSETRRICVPEIEEKLFERMPLLDHGEVQAVDYMGDDSSLAQAARVSYGEGTKTLQDDKNLVRSLIRDLHTTPIEMAELAIESKTPVFVDPRQAGRHRTLDKHGFMGYTPIGDQHYLIPDSEYKYQDRINRQGRGKDMNPEELIKAKALIEESFALEKDNVKILRELGAPEEVIRRTKGVGFYTKTWRTGDAHNWGHYLFLRLDAHAQKEIRAQAKRVNEIVKLHTPIVHEAHDNYFINALRFSVKEQKFLEDMIQIGRLNPDLDLESLDTYKGYGFIIPIRNKQGNKTNEKELGREGQALKAKLERLLGN